MPSNGFDLRLSHATFKHGRDCSAFESVACVLMGVGEMKCHSDIFWVVSDSVLANCLLCTCDNYYFMNLVTLSVDVQQK